MNTSELLSKLRESCILDLRFTASIISVNRVGGWGSRAGGCGSPAVASWISDHRVAGSNPLRGMFHH